MKKVWIASILATLILLVPINSVVGASDIIEDCNCNPVSDLQVVRIERLLDRLESRINFILLRYGHIPEVKEKCEEVLDIINSDILRDFPIICSILENISDAIYAFEDYCFYMYQVHPIFYIILYPLLYALFPFLFFISIYGMIFGCWDPRPP